MSTYQDFLNSWNSWAHNVRERDVPEEIITQANDLAKKIRWIFTQTYGYDTIEEANNSGELSNDEELGPDGQGLYEILLRGLAAYPQDD